ncbi:MAG: hypothetical protein QW201_02675 [Thermoproteota archaeon]
MPMIKTVITTEEEVCKEVRKLISLRKFHYVKLALPGSRDHKRKALPGDRILVSAWRCKDVERKRKVGSENEKTQS